MTRVAAVRAEGTEFVYDLAISQSSRPLRSKGADHHAAHQPDQHVRNPKVATFIRRGGSMNHRYVDTGGQRFETRVVTCNSSGEAGPRALLFSALPAGGPPQLPGRNHRCMTKVV